MKTSEFLGTMGMMLKKGCCLSVWDVYRDDRQLPYLNLMALQIHLGFDQVWSKVQMSPPAGDCVDSDLAMIWPRWHKKLFVVAEG